MRVGVGRAEDPFVACGVFPALGRLRAPIQLARGNDQRPPIGPVNLRQRDLKVKIFILSWTVHRPKRTRARPEDMGICARACASSAQCTHWTFGEQDRPLLACTEEEDWRGRGGGGFSMGRGTKLSTNCSAPRLPTSELRKLRRGEVPGTQLKFGKAVPLRF